MSLSLDRSLLKPVATVVAIVLSLFQIYFTGGFGVTDAHILRGTHLTLIMILVLLLVPSRKLAPGEKEGWFPILIDLALIALAIAINVLGDATGALFVSKLESDFDPERGERLAAAE